MTKAISDAVAGAGGFAAVVSSLRSGDVRVVGVATQLVAMLSSSQDPSVPGALRQQGCIGVVVNMLQSVPAPDVPTQRAALLVLGNLTRSTLERIHTLCGS